MTLPLNNSARPASTHVSFAPIELKRRRPDAPAPQLSTANMSFLRAELNRQPEIRPEVVARAKALAADPNYPPMEALRAVASQIIGSPDLTEDDA